MKSCFTLIIFIFFSGKLFSQKRDVIKQIDDKIIFYEKAKFENTSAEAELTELYYQTKEINYEKGQINAILLLCNYYISKKENYDEIINKGEIADKIAIETDDYSSLSFIRNYIGIAFTELGLVDEGKKKLLSSIKFSKKITNPEERNLFNYKNYKYLAQCYQVEHKKDSVFFYVTNALQKSNEISQGSIFKNDYTVESHLRIAEFYINKKVLDKAKNHLNVADTINKNSFLNAEYLFLMGKFAHLNKEEKSSLEFYVKADSLASRINYPVLKAKIYSEIADFYFRKNDLKKHIYYLKRSSEINDSIDKTKKSQINRINLDNLEESSFFTRNQWFILLLMIVISIFIFYFFFKNKNFIKKVSLPIPKKDAVTKPTPISISDLTYLANEDNPLFYDKFKEVFPDFESKILSINSSLKSLDLEICAFMKLNFSTKQISIIKNISVRAVEGRKYRIRKTLDITQDENMYLWFSNL